MYCDLMILEKLEKVTSFLKRCNFFFTSFLNLCLFSFASAYRPGYCSCYWPGYPNFYLFSAHLSTFLSAQLSAHISVLLSVWLSETSNLTMYLVLLSYPMAIFSANLFRLYIFGHLASIWPSKYGVYRVQIGISNLWRHRSDIVTFFYWRNIIK